MPLAVMEIRGSGPYQGYALDVAPCVSLVYLIPIYSIIRPSCS